MELYEAGDHRFVIGQEIDLSGENLPKTYRQPLDSANSGAHVWRVHITRDGRNQDLTGCTAFAYVRREDEEEGAESESVRLKAQISGSIAWAELDPEVYAMGGQLTAVMRITDAQARVMTMAVLRLQDRTYTTANIRDPQGTVPSLDKLMAWYAATTDAAERASRAIEGAQAAANAAREAARAAQEAADNVQDAQIAADAAQEAARAAQEAVSAAQEAVAIADAWSGAEAEAYGLSGGEAPQVAVGYAESGRRVIRFGIPAGADGAPGTTPQITVSVTTGEPGTQASVTQSGTAEAPVLQFTIPRGDRGEISGLTVNGKTPDAAGALTLAAEDVSAASLGAFNTHAHGLITREGKIAGVSEVRLLVTDAAGNILAARAIDADLTIGGTLTADKVIGAVYA